MTVYTRVHDTGPGTRDGLTSCVGHYKTRRLRFHLYTTTTTRVVFVTRRVRCCGQGDDECRADGGG